MICRIALSIDAPLPSNGTSLQQQRAAKVK
jgi:hypothetical protein